MGMNPYEDLLIIVTKCKNGCRQKRSYKSYTVDEKVFDAINTERVNSSLEALTYNNKLALSAQDHSEDMAMNQFLSAITSNGEEISERMKYYDYEYIHIGIKVGNGTKEISDILNRWFDKSGPVAVPDLFADKYMEIGIGYDSYDDGTKVTHYLTVVIGTPAKGYNPFH